VNNFALEQAKWLCALTTIKFRVKIKAITNLISEDEIFGNIILTYLLLT
jgi:hypothetical protein